MKRLAYRIIMENILGRQLLNSEDVHHVDGNHYNDDPKNLQLMTHAEHTVLHHSGKPLSIETKNKISLARKGHPTRTGAHLSEETKRKISETERKTKRGKHGKVNV